jgi:hypothetical protein
LRLGIPIEDEVADIKFNPEVDPEVGSLCVLPADVVVGMCAVMGEVTDMAINAVADDVLFARWPDVNREPGWSVMLDAKASDSSSSINRAEVEGRDVGILRSDKKRYVFGRDCGAVIGVTTVGDIGLPLLLFVVVVGGVMTVVVIAEGKFNVFCVCDLVIIWFPLRGRSISTSALIPFSPPPSRTDKYLKSSPVRTPNHSANFHLA